MSEKKDLKVAPEAKALPDEALEGVVGGEGGIPGPAEAVPGPANGPGQDISAVKVKDIVTGGITTNIYYPCIKAPSPAIDKKST